VDFYLGDAPFECRLGYRLRNFIQSPQTNTAVIPQNSRDGLLPDPCALMHERLLILLIANNVDLKQRCYLTEE